MSYILLMCYLSPAKNLTLNPAAQVVHALSCLKVLFPLSLVLCND